MSIQYGKHRLEIKVTPELFANLKTAAEGAGLVGPEHAGNAARTKAVAELIGLHRTEQNITATIDHLTKVIRRLQNTRQKLLVSPP